MGRVLIFQYRRQDFLSSGANVGRANNVRMEAQSAEFANSAHRSRHEALSSRETPSPRKAPSEIGGRGLGRGLGE